MYKQLSLIFFLLTGMNLFGYQEIFKTALKTKNAFDNFTFSWTAVHGNPSKNHMEVDVIHDKETTKLSLFAVYQDERKLINVTYITKAAWFVSENNETFKYKPLEAHYKNSKTYQYLMKSKVQFFSSRNVKQLGSFSDSEQNEHHFYQQVSEGEKEAIRKQVDLIRNEYIPKAQTRGEENFFLVEAKRLLDYAQKGKLNIVNDSGIISRLDSVDGVVEIKNFKWLTLSNHTLLDLPEHFVDLSKEMISSNEILISYNGLWNPKRKDMITDGKFLNIESGHIRRIPFKGTRSTPYGFDAEQGIVYLTGRLPGRNAISPFALNIKTGKMSPLGSRSLQVGHVTDMSLSANKNKLVLIHNPEPHLGDLHQLVVLDFKQKNLKKFKVTGTPTKTSWLDKDTILYSSFNEETQIAEIYLVKTGRSPLKIAEGTYPTSLNNDQDFIFLDMKDQLWKVFNTKTQTSKAFHDGLPKLQFPQIDTKNKKIYMILRDEENWPVPVSIDMNNQKIETLTKQKGLWLTPVSN
ncbi:MAG: hypothetical protein NE330_22935 [Lentisphaeraceae bacterium]|nr:hypothetical protein [Lentisphaeraceae bacterium]